MKKKQAKQVMRVEPSVVGTSEFKQAAMARMQALHESPLEYLKEKKMEISQISPAVKDVGWSEGMTR